MKITYDPHLLGPEGEQIAADYLLSKGYRIIRRNYRFHRNEIDIIALHHKTLCFVEVKTRFSSAKGHPAEAVTPMKQREIIKAAQAYLTVTDNIDTDCRFDVLAILIQNMDGNRIDAFTVEHFKDAFWASS
ncbi:MAG: YraN family protein [Chlorobium sp.]|nr:MAG: YraN family protein [Chlorobium sp.]